MNDMTRNTLKRFTTLVIALKLEHGVSASNVLDEARLYCIRYTMLNGATLYHVSGNHPGALRAYWANHPPLVNIPDVLRDIAARPRINRVVKSLAFPPIRVYTGKVARHFITSGDSLAGSIAAQ